MYHDSRNFSAWSYKEKEEENYYWASMIDRAHPIYDIEKAFYQEFPREQRHRQRFVSFVFELRTWHLAVMVFDIRSRKVLKKTLLLPFELYDCLNYFSEFHGTSPDIKSAVLNPFTGTLHITMSVRYEVVGGETGNYYWYQDGLERYTQRKELRAETYQVYHYNKNREFRDRECRVQVDNIFDHEKRLFQGEQFPSIESRLELKGKNIMFWKLDQNLQIELCPVTKTAWETILLDSREIQVGSIQEVREVGEDSILITTPHKAILASKSTQKVLDEIILSEWFEQQYEQNFKTYKNLMFIGHETYFSIYKIMQREGGGENQEGNQNFWRPPVVKQVGEYPFYMQLSPKVGKIQSIIDFRAFGEQNRFLSLLLDVDHYFDDARLESERRILHSVFDMSSSQFLSFKTVSMTPPDFLKTDNQFLKRLIDISLDEQLRIVYQPRGRSDYVWFSRLTLPTFQASKTDLNEEIYCSEDIERNLGTLKSFSSERELSFEIKSDEVLESFFDGLNIYRVKLGMSESKRVYQKNVCLYRLKEDVQKEYDVIHGDDPILYVGEGSLNLIREYECRSYLDKVSFARQAERGTIVYVYPGPEDQNDSKTPNRQPTQLLRCTVLDHGLNPLIDCEVLGERLYGSEMKLGYSFEWLGQGRLFVCVQISREGANSTPKYNSLVIDSRKKRLYKLCVRRAGGGVSEVKSGVFWASGNNLLMYHLSKKYVHQTEGVYQLELED